MWILKTVELFVPDSPEVGANRDGLCGSESRSSLLTRLSLSDANREFVVHQPRAIMGLRLWVQGFVILGQAPSKLYTNVSFIPEHHGHSTTAERRGCWLSEEGNCHHSYAHGHRQYSMLIN